MSLSGDLDDVLNPLLAAFDPTLEAELTDELTDIYMSGVDQMVKWGKGGTIVEVVDPGGRIVIPPDYEGPPRAKAISWARRHGATLVTQMDEETKKQLAGVVAQGIKDKRGVDGIGRDIRREIQSMSVKRGKLIARTETASALSQGSLDAMTDMGIDGKEWVTSGDDRVSDECQANEDQGVIPVNQAFTSGAMAPPQHPDCRCALAPARLPVAAAPAEPVVPPTKPPAVTKPIRPTKPVKPTKPAEPVAKAKGPTGKEWKETLTQTEQEAMRGWGSSGYIDIREFQRTGMGLPRIKKYTKALESAMQKDGAYNGTTYRGLAHLDPKAMNAVRNSKVITLDATTSATKDFKIAADFARGSGKGNSIIFDIKTKTGVDYGTFSVKESEVLLHKGASYRVVGQEEGVFIGRGGQKVKAVKMYLEEF